MFQSQAAKAVEDSIIRARWLAEEARLDEAADRLALYQDDYESIIRATMSKLFCKENYDRLFFHVNGSQNILKRVVNEISMVYKTDAKRTLDVDSDRYETIKSEIEIDGRMRRVNRLTNLLNDTIIKIAVRDGAIAYDILTPDICTVIQNQDDPTKISAVSWMRSWLDTVSNRLIYEYEYIDDLGWWAVLDSNFRAKQIIYDPDTYPYRDATGRPVMPLVCVHRQQPETRFWDPDSGRDLYNAAVMLGVKMTMFDYLFKATSFKQIYIVGGHVPDKQVMDAVTVLHAQGDPNTTVDIGTLDLQTNVANIVQALTFQLNSVINNYGISADMWTLSISEMSGRALKIKNRALLEQRAEQVPTYRKAEQELFEKTRLINNTHAGFFGWEKIPENAKLKVDFAEVEFPEDPNYEIALEATRLNSGLVSLGRFYQEFNPDITDEAEAEKVILGNLNKLKDLKAENPSLDSMLNQILKTSASSSTGASAGAGESEGGQA